MSAGRARECEACLFDLDGTLLDSIELIFQSYEHTFRVHGIAAVPRAVILASLGRTLKDSFGEHSSDALDVERMIATYREFNLAHHDELVKPYAGALDTVAALRSRGLGIGIVTSKKRDTARRGLALCGFEDEFDVFVAMEDTARHKPHKEPLERAVRELALEPWRACYVGDSPHDVAAGNAAGVPVFVALWGPFSRPHFVGTRVEAWVEHPRELLELVTPQAVRE